jgi:hypothetical protein
MNLPALGRGDPLSVARGSDPNLPAKVEGGPLLRDERDRVPWPSSPARGRERRFAAVAIEITP